MIAGGIAGREVRVKVKARLRVKVRVMVSPAEWSQWGLHTH